MYDVTIIGAGPAGITAAIYAARKKLKTLVITKQVGGQMIISSDVENYTGFSMVTGADLTAKFEQHLESLKEDLEIKSGVEVINLEKNITSFSVEDSKGNVYYSKAVIIAVGKEPKHLGIPGEKEFYGHGVSTCATCDGPLYKGKDVAVIGGGNSALDAIVALAKSANKIYVINVNDNLMGEDVVRNKIMQLANVEVMNSAKALEITGDKSVSGIKIQPYGKPEQDLAVAGVFVEIGYETKLMFDNLTKKNEAGEIIVDKDSQSSVPGIFAAGDVNDAWGDQIIIAAGEGAKAALAAADYLNKLK